MALVTLAFPFQISAQSVIAETPAALAPGDIVRITVWRRPEFTGDFVVAPDSSITHPLMREVKVAGVAFKTVEDRLHVFLTKFDANPAFVVSPLLRVFVGGEVRQPNVYNVPPGSTVAQLVALAGGPTDRGQLENVMIVRQQLRENLDLTSPQSTGAALEVRSGDQVIVNRRRSLLADFIVPAGSNVGAAAALANLFLHR